MSESSRPRPEGWTQFVADLGVQLQKRRHDAGLSQEALAALAGMSRFRYQLLESGGRGDDDANPTLLVLVRLANALDVDVADLIPGHRHLRG